MKNINFKKLINFDFKKSIILNLKRIISFNFKKNIYLIIKKYSRFKVTLLYLLAIIIILPTIYLSIPAFFDYEKSKKIIEDKIYSEFNLKSSIQGKINYSFIPSPRIKVKKLIIKDFLDKNKNLGEVELAVLKIPFKNLATFKDINFKKIEIKKFKGDVDLNKLSQYRKFFKENFKSKNFTLIKSTFNLNDKNKHLATLRNTRIDFNNEENFNEIELKGKLFEKNILINFKDKSKLNSPSVVFIKYPSLNFRTSIVLFNPDSENNANGKASFFLNRFKGNISFLLKNSSIKIKDGNIRNRFVNGKILGDITFFPFFNFDLDLNLASLNFRSLVKILVKMSNQNINDFLILNNKINGNLNIFINKIYTSSKIIKSLESRVKFSNRDIIIDQMLFDLGKLGAADITGRIKNKDNKINFIFKKNLFLDNPKYFFNKFSVYNKNSNPQNLFISGRFNFTKPKIYISELITDSKLSEDDKSFYQEEFNQMLLENGYSSLFDFFKLKEFVKLINIETKQN